MWETFLKNWEIFLAILPAISIFLRGTSEALYAIAQVLQKPQLGEFAKSIGYVVLIIAKILGYFGMGTPKALVKGA